MAPALKVIDGICPEGSNNEYVLPGEWGTGHFVNLQRPWERIRAAAGLDDVRIHDLRHAFASLGAATGDSLLVIGALLGHRSAKTTHRYAHLAEHPVKDAADRISAEMSRLLGDGAPAAESASAGPSLDAGAGETAGPSRCWDGSARPAGCRPRPPRSILACRRRRCIPTAGAGWGRSAARSDAGWSMLRLTSTLG